MSAKIEIECGVRHVVDQDDDGAVRYAEVGDPGLAEPLDGDRWSVTWPSGAWGFYSTPELAEVM